VQILTNIKNFTMKKLFFSLITIFFIFFGNYTKGCTNFLITKGASADGSVMISYNADSHVLYGELYFWPAMDWPSGAMLDIYEWDTGNYLGQIPQVAHTYSVVGNMNENQVSLGETTYGGLPSLQHQKGAIVDYGSLMYIALQRSKTAREAIQIMGDLVGKYGYASEGESFSVSDKNEAWIFEMIGKGEGEKGAVWVARKVPDGYICGHANHARITTFPQNDPDNCVFSKDVISFAKTKGLYKGDDKNFSFSDTYAPVDFEGARFCEIRVWAAFNMVNKDMKQYFDYCNGDIKHDDKFADGTPNPNKYATNRMPLWIKPDRKVTLDDMAKFLADHLEGTELDMTKDVGAGPYGCPYRWRPLTWKITAGSDADLKQKFAALKKDTIEYCNERASGTQQTGFTFIAQSRAWLPDQIGGIFWFGVDDAASTVRTPIYCGVSRVPVTYERGNGAMMEFSENSAFWAFNQVANFSYTRYNVIHPEIDSLRTVIETRNQKYVKGIDMAAEQMYKTDPKTGREFITDFSVNTANALVYQWKDFYKYLFMKYMDGNIKKPNRGHLNPFVKQPGYGQDWYRRIAKDTDDKLMAK
jgi:dipeptidase